MTNVALIVLDTVRKDYFDEHASRLRELADVEFERCYAPSSWSIPSHASMFAGELPHRHGVHTYNPDYGALDETFLDHLPHASLGVSANGAVSDAFDADALFDRFYSFAGNDEFSLDAVSYGEVADVRGLGRYLAYLDAARRRGVLTESLVNGLSIKINEFLDGKPLPKLGDFGASTVVEKAVSLTEAEPFFLFLNFIDAHGPMENRRCLDSSVSYRWSSREIDDEAVRRTDRERLGEYLECYRDLYAANVRYLDEQVSSLVRRIRRRTNDDTVFIVTADHGEELRLPGERDLGHMDFSTPLLHVPFVVIGADGPDVSEPTSLLDVDEIVQRVANGGDVPDVSREAVPAERPGMMFYDGQDEYWTRGVRTVVEDDVRYEWDTRGTSVRYSVRRSRDGEPTEVDVPDRLRSLFDEDLGSFVERARAEKKRADVDAKTARQLENLGYKV